MKNAENKVTIGGEELVVEDVTDGNLSASSGYIGFNSDPSSGNDTRFVIEFKDGVTEDVDLNKLATTTHGFVGADLESLCKEAAMRVVRRILPEIKNDDEEIPEEVLKKIIVTNEGK